MQPKKLFGVNQRYEPDTSPGPCCTTVGLEIEIMKLIPAAKEHLHTMMSWFPDKDSCRIWGGPDFRFPFSKETFVEDARIDVLPSYSMLSDNSEIVAFGQYYERENRCHLSRLVVSPRLRNHGIGRKLIKSISQIGCDKLSKSECSLFVSEHNNNAIRFYKTLGFEESIYPGEGSGLEGCLYMVIKFSQLQNMGKSPARK